MTVKEYLKRKNARLNTLFRAKPDGNRVYVLDDKTEVSEQQFLKQNDLPDSLHKYLKPNPDGRHDWNKV